jgi:glycosyltransferase involved in cell wall biosynthesis
MPSVSDVLHVYSGNLFGGVERMLISLATLPAPHHRAHFALCFDGKLSQALQSERATVTLLGPVRLRRPMSVFRARNALKRLLAARNFDAVVCHSIWTYCIFAPVIARAGKVSILYLHDIPNSNGAYYKWAWRNPPDLCIANSATTAEPLAQMGSKVPVRIVHPLVMPPPPADFKAVETLRHQCGAAPNEVVILLASRFEQLKGHKNLIEALSHLSENTTWRCWIAGAPQRPEEETYKQGLAQMIESCRISQRVSFIGHRGALRR